MNITRENTEDLKVIIKININESDYIENYEKSLKTYQRKATIHGFRPGKVPMSYILNSHGRSIKYEEISKLSTDAFEKYLTENNFDYLFSPTLLPEGLDDEHWIEQKDFVFTYEVILKPEIDFNIENLEVDYCNVIPPQMLIDSMVKNARSERGDIIDQEAIIEECSFNCNFEELDIEGNVNEDGNKNNSSIKLEDIKDADTKNKLIGLKTTDTIVINPFVAFDNANSTARFLKTDTKDEALRSNYKLVINEIQTIKLAEFTPEFYKSIYPNDDIQTEEEFLERVKIEGSVYYAQQTDQLFYSDAMASILQADKYTLPDELIKQALIDFNHGDITAEMLEKDYKSYRGSIVYISFEKYIKDKYNFSVTYEDVKAYMKSRFLSQFGGMQDLDNQLLTAIDKFADDQLKDKKQYKEARENAYELLLIKLLKETIKINYKSITFDEFVAKLKATQHTHEHEHQHEHEHDHDHEHDHNHDHNHDHDHEHHHDHNHGHDHNHDHGDHHHHSH